VNLPFYVVQLATERVRICMNILFSFKSELMITGRVPGHNTLLPRASLGYLRSGQRSIIGPMSMALDQSQIAGHGSIS
jgi:hypothetical protein